MIRVLYNNLPAGALSVYDVPQDWDRMAILTLTPTAEWVPATWYGPERYFLQSGTILEAPLPRQWRPPIAPHALLPSTMQALYDEVMGELQVALIEIVHTVGYEDGTLAIVDRGTTWGSFGARLNFGLGFTQGNVFNEEDGWFQPPREPWCPREIPPIPAPPGKTLWERLLESLV